MVKQWRERIRNYESTYTTDNGLYIVDCTSVQETLLPKLGSIHQELCVFVNEQAVTLAEKFCNEMKTCIQVIIVIIIMRFVFIDKFTGKPQ